MNTDLLEPLFTHEYQYIKSRDCTNKGVAQVVEECCLYYYTDKNSPQQMLGLILFEYDLMKTAGASCHQLPYSLLIHFKKITSFLVFSRGWQMFSFILRQKPLNVTCFKGLKS